jgi:hypothetical protein
MHRAQRDVRVLANAASAAYLRQPLLLRLRLTLRAQRLARQLQDVAQFGPVRIRAQ